MSTIASHPDPLQTGATMPAAKPLLKIRPASGWAAINLGEAWRFRDLMLSLAGRDLKLRYKQTALGAAWVVLQPLLAAGIFSFVFGRVARLPGPAGVPYFVFAYAGLLGWNLFNNTLTKASTCLVGNAHLISKVFFPRLILPLSTVPSTLVDFAVALAMMAALLLANGVGPGAALLLMPLWLVLLLTLSLGVGLIAAALTVSYRDVQYVMPVILQMLLYASPVAYAVDAVPAGLRPWYYLNPLAPLLEGFRGSLLGTGQPPWPWLAYAAAVAVASLLVGTVLFKRMERKFADVI